MGFPVHGIFALPEVGINQPEEEVLARIEMEAAGRASGTVGVLVFKKGATVLRPVLLGFGKEIEYSPSNLERFDISSVLSDITSCYTSGRDSTTGVIAFKEDMVYIVAVSCSRPILNRSLALAALNELI